MADAADLTALDVGDERTLLPPRLRQCSRCREFSPDPVSAAVRRSDAWWLCDGCRETLLGTKSARRS